MTPRNEVVNVKNISLISAFGFLVPSSQKEPILGVIFDTCSFPQVCRHWPNHRIEFSVKFDSMLECDQSHQSRVQLWLHWFQGSVKSYAGIFYGIGSWMEAFATSRLNDKWIFLTSANSFCFLRVMLQSCRQVSFGSYNPKLVHSLTCCQLKCFRTRSPCSQSCWEVLGSSLFSGTLHQLTTSRTLPWSRFVLASEYWY